MIAERTIVDAVADAPGFVRMFPSSEVTPSPWAPAASPTWLHHAVTDGALEVPRRAVIEVARVRIA